MITVINHFTVTGEEEAFRAAAHQMTEYMCAQPGWQSYQLLKSAKTPGSWVEVAEWKDREDHLAAVTSDGFKERVAALRDLATPNPDVFVPVELAGASA